MLCLIQTHMHTNMFSMEYFTETCHTSSCYACSCSISWFQVHSGLQPPSLVFDAMGFYTHESYTFSGKVSFNQDLTFNVHDFIICSCSHTIYALYTYFHTYAALIITLIDLIITRPHKRTSLPNFWGI